MYTVTCYLHANISWSCQPLALDWIQRKIISDGLALNWIHNKFLESQFLALDWIMRNIRIKTVAMLSGFYLRVRKIMVWPIFTELGDQIQAKTAKFDF